MFYQQDLLSINGGRFSTIWLLGLNPDRKVLLPSGKTRKIPLRDILSLDLRSIAREFAELIPESAQCVSLRVASICSLGFTRSLMFKVKAHSRNVTYAKVEISRQVRQRLTATNEIDVAPAEPNKVTLPEPDYMGELGQGQINAYVRQFEQSIIRDLEEWRENEDGKAEVVDTPAGIDLVMSPAERQQRLAQITMPDEAFGRLVENNEDDDDDGGFGYQPPPHGGRPSDLVSAAADNDLYSQPEAGFFFCRHFSI